MSLADEHTDPTQPDVPKSDQPGRLLTASTLHAGWPCRWCLRYLSRTPAGAVVCCDCDAP